MVEVYFEVPTGRGKLDDNGCIDLFFVIEKEIKNKIGELEKTQRENHIHQKCQEIDQYLQKQKNSHNECYQDSFKRYIKDIEGTTSSLLSQSSVYSKYCISATSKDAGSTKPKVATKELGEEKGKSKPEKHPSEESSQTLSSCSGKACRDESSENKALPVANQTDGPEPSERSAVITPRPSEGTTVILDSPSAVFTRSELDRDRSDTCKEKSCPPKDLSSLGHSTTEGSEPHLSTPSSQRNVLHISNPTVTYEDYIGDISNTIFPKNLTRYKNGPCELNVDKGSKDSNGNITTIKLLNCGTENAEYTISEYNNHEAYGITANSQISLSTDIPLSSPPNGGDIKFPKVTSPEEHQLPEGMKSTEHLHSSQLKSIEEERAEVKGALNNRAASNHQEMSDMTMKSPFQRRGNDGTHLHNFRIYNSVNYDTSQKHVQPTHTYHTSYEENTKNDIRDGYILNKDSYPMGEQGIIDIEDTELSTPLEEPSLKNYITIIAMILGGILFCALLSKFTPLGTLFSRKKKKKKKKLKKNCREYYREKQALKKEMSTCRTANYDINNVVRKYKQRMKMY